jgi:hypothetical protein
MKSITIDTIEQPKTTYTQRERETLLDRLTEIACDGFGTTIAREDVALRAFEADFLHVLRIDEHIVGFSAYKRFALPEGTVLHCNGTVLERAVHRRGLYTVAKLLALSAERADFVTLRTQNPVIYDIIKKLACKVYPDVKEAPETIRRVAAYIGGELMEPDTFVARGFYGTSLAHAVAGSAESRLLFDTLRVDYARGDAVIVVGELQ